MRISCLQFSDYFSSPIATIASILCKKMELIAVASGALNIQFINDLLHFCKYDDDVTLELLRCAALSLI